MAFALCLTEQNLQALDHLIVPPSLGICSRNLEAKTVKFSEHERIAGTAKFAGSESPDSFNIVAIQYKGILSDCMESAKEVSSLASSYCCDKIPQQSNLSKEEVCFGTVRLR